MVPTKVTVWSEVAALLAASLILIASIAWSEALGTWFESLSFFKNNPITARFMFAVVITIVAAIVLAWLKPFRSTETFRQEPGRGQ
jgi:hypothetical protein